MGLWAWWAVLFYLFCRYKFSVSWCSLHWTVDALHGSSHVLVVCFSRSGSWCCLMLVLLLSPDIHSLSACICLACFPPSPGPSSALGAPCQTDLRQHWLGNEDSVLFSCFFVCVRPCFHAFGYVSYCFRHDNQIGRDFCAWNPDCNLTV